MTPADRIRHRRKGKGLTQTDLAARIGCDQTTLSDYETGRAVPPMARAHALAEALDCTLDDLFGPEAEVVA